MVTASTPFHPVDHGWPDQGPDRGTATIGGSRRDVIDVVLGATDGGPLHLGADIPARRGSPGWTFVVVHLLAVGTPVPDPGTAVRLEVDAAHRDPLSAGHTACHLAALALNAALADRWRKPVPLGCSRASAVRPAGDHVVRYPTVRCGGHVPARKVAAQEGFRRRRSVRRAARGDSGRECGVGRLARRRGGGPGRGGRPRADRPPRVGLRATGGRGADPLRRNACDEPGRRSRW